MEVTVAFCFKDSNLILHTADSVVGTGVAMGMSATLGRGVATAMGTFAG